MAVLQLRVCDRHLPERVLAEGKKWTLKIGEYRLEYDLCSDHRQEMDVTAKETVRSISGRGKVVAARKSKAKSKKPRATRSTTKITKRGAKYPCRVEGCTEGPFASGQARGQHERFTHGGAVGTRKAKRDRRTAREAKKVRRPAARKTARKTTARKKVAAAKN
jgi:hypothetical protein